LAQPDAHVLVVGAGIAGLCFGLALSRIGVDVEIIERVNEMKEVGAAISLWPAALAALGNLGVEEEVRAVGWPAPSLRVRGPSGRTLVDISPEQLRRALGGEGLVVHRADLQRVLLDAVSNVPIQFGVACASARQGGDTVTVQTEAGDELRADAVVGCDGVRTAIGPAVPGQLSLRYQGVTTWRAVVDHTDLVNEGWLSVGEGKQIVASPLSGSRCYWSPMLRMKAGVNATLSDPIAFLLKAFSGWHAPIPEMIAKTSPGSVIRSDVYDRLPTRLASGRIALAGDAAHPMTPALGQGACQAIEDAAVLGAAWKKHRDAQTAFAAFERVRLRPVRRVVADSRQVNRVFSSRSRVVDRLSRGIVARLPDSFMLSMSARHGNRHAFDRSLAELGP
jgi:2-polyprenyl-6-methoxyphenol hydroxylase-like FAD-dependent oxidoreductase